MQVVVGGRNRWIGFSTLILMYLPDISGQSFQSD